MTDRKAIAAAFRAAKQELWDGSPSTCLDKFRYICNALDSTKSNAKEAAKAVIGSRLMPERFLYTWLMTKGIDADDYPPECLQAHRHAWLDMLIAEFEGEEK
jgi:hypothetical protein